MSRAAEHKDFDKQPSGLPTRQAALKLAAAGSYEAMFMATKLFLLTDGEGAELFKSLNNPKNDEQRKLFMLNLGLCHALEIYSADYVRMTDKDRIEHARGLLKEATKPENPQAKYALAEYANLLFTHGSHSYYIIQEQEKLLENAKDNVVAKLYLSNRHIRGAYLPQIKQKAVQTLKDIAKGDDIFAIEAMYRLYDHLYYSTQDLSKKYEAIQLLTHAAALGHESAERLLSHMSYLRLGDYYSYYRGMHHTNRAGSINIAENLARAMYNYACASISERHQDQNPERQKLAEQGIKNVCDILDIPQGMTLNNDIATNPRSAYHELCRILHGNDYVIRNFKKLNSEYANHPDKRTLIVETARACAEMTLKAAQKEAKEAKENEELMAKLKAAREAKADKTQLVSLAGAPGGAPFVALNIRAEGQPEQAGEEAKADKTQLVSLAGAPGGVPFVALNIRAEGQPEQAGEQQEGVQQPAPPSPKAFGGRISPTRRPSQGQAEETPDKRSWCRT